MSYFVDTIPNYAHYASSVVHLVTGEHIMSYKRLMNDLAMAKTWQTAFGKDFGRMAAGDNKTSQKGINSIFVMTHDEIRALPKDQAVTYVKVVINQRPQKEDSNHVQITAGGNLIQYEGNLSTCTADITTSKILWNSVLSTKNAK